jgi:competence protein ComEA
MNAAPPPVTPAPAPPVWPRPAQLATAVLLLLATALFTLHGLASWSGGSRPTELRQGADAVHPIDLNQAGRAELLQLPGVGDGLAGRIETYRQEHGGFRTVDELRQVRGVGPTMLERLRPSLIVRADKPSPADDAPDRTTPAPVRRPGRARAETPAPGKPAKLAGRINVNRATAAQLQTLPGIGPKLAQRILDERARGRFRSVDDLRRVSGIGPKTLDRLRPHVTVGDPPIDVAAVAAEESAN